MIARGAAPERVRVFANTIDVEEFGERADRLAGRRPELRRALGAGADDVVVLSVARLAPEKGLDVLVRAVAAAERSAPRARRSPARAPSARGSRSSRASSACGSCSRATSTWERIVELYVAADVFALLSEREPWAVVVNEAAACGLPLVLSDRVGAAHDLLRDGENGALVARRRRRRRSGGAPRARRGPGAAAARRARARASSRATGATGRASRASSTAVREAVADRS